MKTKSIRHVMIDSEINSVGGGELTKLNFPPSVFSVSGSQQSIKITLASFTMRRNFYNVNQSNNRFYWFSGGVFTEITIQPGTYPVWGTNAVGVVAPPTNLIEAVFNAIQAAVPGLVTGITQDVITRKLTLTIAGGQPANSRFVFFQCKTAANQPAGVSDDGFFGDCFELFGCYPTRDGWNPLAPVDGFTGLTTGGAVPATVLSPFVVQLNTLEAIYIRTNLHSGNYQSYGFERELPNQQGVTPTQIWARIPLTKQYYLDEEPFITFEDTNNIFEMFLNQTQLSQVYFELTDDKNRQIPQVNTGVGGAVSQAAIGLLAFKLTFKFETVVDDTPSHDNALQLKNVSKGYEHLAMNGLPRGA